MNIRSQTMLGSAALGALLCALVWSATTSLSRLARPLAADIPANIEAARANVRLDGLTGLITYYDEVLTQAARNYAFTGDRRWERRYLSAEPELDAVLEEAVRHADETGRGLFRAVSKDNDKLVAIEHRALSLAGQGRRAEAAALLEDPSYWREKRRLARRVQSYLYHRGLRQERGFDASWVMVRTAALRAQEQLRESVRSLSLMGAAFLIGLALFAWQVRRALLSPLLALTAHVRRAGTGEAFSPVDPELASLPNELGDLATAFADMMDKRVSAEETLRRRMALWALIGRASSELIARPAEQIPPTIQAALASVGAMFAVDRAYLFLFSDDGKRLSNAYEWSARGVPPQARKLQELPVETLHWWMEHLSDREVVNIPHVADMPREAGAERQLLQAHGIRSLIALPLQWGGKVDGFVGFDSVTRDRSWTEDEVHALETIANTFAQALGRKRAEETLRQLNLDLEATVARRTAELQRSNRDLEQFAYVASHDLQEPLRMVSSYTELLARRYRGKLDEDADEFIRYSVDGARRMQAMIKDLLVFSRVGRQSRFARVSSESALSTALANLDAAVAESGAQVRRDGPSMPEIVADRAQLAQLFQNLVGNALKYRGERRPIINVGWAREDGAWRFSVADNGIGIDPRFHERIFAIFQRLHSRADYPGTGIGLAICKRIVEHHGGRIWVESVPGQGSTFHFTISDRLTVQAEAEE